MPSWSPYVYTFNNPIRFTDPTGMVPNDWVLMNGVWKYDKDITTLEQAQNTPGVTGFAENGSIIRNTTLNEGSTVYSNLRLNEGGTVTSLANDELFFEPLKSLITVTRWSPEEFPQISNYGGMARSDFDFGSWDKKFAVDKLFQLDQGSFISPAMEPGGKSWGERFSALMEGYKNIMDIGTNGKINEKPDTLKSKATYVYPEGGGLFKDTTFAVPYRNNEKIEHALDRLNKKIDSVKAVKPNLQR